VVKKGLEELLSEVDAKGLDVKILCEPNTCKLISKAVNNAKISTINAYEDEGILLAKKIQELDVKLYNKMGAPHWVVFTFGAKTGFTTVIVKEKEIISYCQISGCIDANKVQLWGLGTSKEYQHKGYATLCYKLTKKICKYLGKNYIEINVEPSNISNKIYEKDKPKLVASGDFYPNEEKRNILQVKI
jgi:ribosomal protein S18 acetylase RimI-like enzyme